MMIRDADFYRARWRLKKLRRVRRMSPRRLEHADFHNASIYAALAHADKLRHVGTKWRWRRNRAEIRARTEEENLSIEAGLHGVAAMLQTWPDTWKHVHYFWPKFEPAGPKWQPLVMARRPGCICGQCEHGVETKKCAVCIPNALGALLTLAAPFLLGLIKRDVQ